MPIKLVFLSLSVPFLVGSTGFAQPTCSVCWTVNFTFEEDIAAPLPSHSCSGEAECSSEGLGCTRCDGHSLLTVSGFFIPDQYCTVSEGPLNCIDAEIWSPDHDLVSWNSDCCPFVTMQTCYN